MIYFVVKSRKIKIISIVILSLLICLIHGLYVIYQSNKVLPSKLFHQDINLDGVIIDIPSQTNYSWQFLLNTKYGVMKLSWNHKVLNEALIPGQLWRFKIKLKEISPMRNPAGFDYGSWLKQQNIVATGYIVNHKAQLIGFDFFNAPVSFIRYQLKEKLKLLLSDHSFMGIFNALVIGNKKDIPSNQKEVFQKTATAHLIAISGLHVGLVALWSYLLLRIIWPISKKLAYFMPAQKAGWLFAILIATIYSMLAGFLIPTQRALMMLTLFVLFYLSNLSVSKRYILIITALIIVLYNPYSILHPGFWLSFCAVGFLLFVFTGRLGSGSLVKRLLWPQWVATMTLIPMTLYYFGGFSIIGFLANLIMVPVVSFVIVPGLLISLLVSMFNDFFAKALLNLIDGIFNLLWQYVLWLSSLKISFLQIVIYPSVMFLALALLGMTLFFLPRSFPNRVFGSFFLLPLLFYRPSWPDNIDSKLTLLDVGHGLSLIFQQKGYTLIYDTGGKLSSGSDMAELVIIPYLKSEGITSIDRLIISHGDLDHSGGLASLLKAMNVKHLDASSDKNMPKKYLSKWNHCHENISFQYANTDFTYLNPQYLSEGTSANDLSCVLKISTPYLSVLIPGDIEKKAERYLVNYHYGQLNSDILIAPHHGSKSSSTRPFLNAVSPKVILIGNGKSKSDYFPHKSVRQLYRVLMIDYFDTASNGAVQLVSYADDKIDINTIIGAKSSTLTR